jgi:hypothetical protein
MKDKKSVKVSYEDWKELSKMKIELELTKLSEVVHLLVTKSMKGGNKI